jgi:hypothetical protein
MAKSYGSKMGTRGGGGMIKAPSPKGAVIRAGVKSLTFTAHSRGTSNNLASIMRSRGKTATFPGQMRSTGSPRLGRSRGVRSGTKSLSSFNNMQSPYT